MKPATLMGEPSAGQRSRDPLVTGLMFSMFRVGCERMNFRLTRGRSEAEFMVRASIALSLTLAGARTFTEAGCIMTGPFGHRVNDDM